MIDVSVLNAMAEAGATVQAIIAAVAALQKKEVEQIAEKREKERQRKRRQRLSRGVPRTDEGQTQKPNDFKDHVPRCPADPLTIPIKNLPSEEERKTDSQILDFAGARPEEKTFGYSSSDGSVSFTGGEIDKLSLDCYTLTNVYGQVRNLSESAWVTGMRPLDRKRAVVNKIKKLHRERLNSFAPDQAEQQAVAKHKSESWQDDQERARQVRKRLYGDRSAG